MVQFQSEKQEKQDNGSCNSLMQRHLFTARVKAMTLREQKRPLSSLLLRLMSPSRLVTTLVFQPCRALVLTSADQILSARRHNTPPPYLITSRESGDTCEAAPRLLRTEWFIKRCFYFPTGSVLQTTLTSQLHLAARNLIGPALNRTGRSFLWESLPLQNAWFLSQTKMWNKSNTVKVHQSV